jgi:hypothetical protein
MNFPSARGHRHELGGDGDDVRHAGACGVLGAVVRPLPDDRAGNRRPGQGVRRQDQVLQAQHGPEPQRAVSVRHPQHPHRPHLQGRREEGERRRRRPKDHARYTHRQVRRQLIIDRAHDAQETIRKRLSFLTVCGYMQNISKPMN